MKIDADHKEFLEQVKADGKEYLIKFGNCGQSTFAALAKNFGLENDQAAKAAFAFGGGLGGTGLGPCGALGAAALFVSSLLGREISKMETDSPFDYGKGMGLIEELINAFRAEYNGITCRDVQLCLMGKIYDVSTPQAHDVFVADGSHEKCCGRAVSFVCGALAEMAARGDLEI